MTIVLYRSIEQDLLSFAEKAASHTSGALFQFFITLLAACGLQAFPAIFFWYYLAVTWPSVLKGGEHMLSYVMCLTSMERCFFAFAYISRKWMAHLSYWYG